MSSYYTDVDGKGYSRSQYTSKAHSTPTPEKWVDLTSTQEGSYDNPGSPRPARDIRSTNEDDGLWGYPAESKGKHVESVENTDASDNGDEVWGRSVNNWRGWSDDTRDAGADIVANRNDVWEDCGLSYNRRSSKGNWDSKSTRAYEVANDTYQKSAEKKQGWSISENTVHDDWDVPSRNSRVGAPEYQKSTRTSRWGAVAQDTQDNCPVAQAPAWDVYQDPTTYRTRGAPPAGHASSWNNGWSAGGDTHPPDARAHPSDRPAPRFNYDGNRTALDGSRVFYAAIIPPIPVLSDISNHAEYVAWLDKLKSTLKYHQLDGIIAKDANRPSNHVAAKRWDQDKLRAAIIIKGGLGFEAFEHVMAFGWEDREDPTGTIDAIKNTHDSMCSCSLANSMTLLDF
ncbi:uncharacterized protein DNG_02579 [Cephalotrichum gorgonifer]|uniref:Uncharacterized protein n=1 Tax=Cephalotrichum gorgonifer TaxID=2041049 RepID=A0AAE8SSQ8_9PEZI|nr:uncharacterized protein DNG_02579 [Cephalotrichum gorgonifer]